MELLILFLLVLKFNVINCNSCNSIKNCGDCIGNPFEKCVWCEQEDLNENVNRCELKNHNNSATWCKPQFIVDPKPLLNITKDAKDWTLDGSKVQFRPLEMKIKVRPGVKVTFPVSYNPAKHYPLDIYYLIDNSYSMIDHKKSLMRQVYNIYYQLSNFTNNVQFGVGTFIEKPAFPYFDASLKTSISYSFKHHLSLTPNITLFNNVMKDTPEGSNYDDPESTLDALMQVMACVNITGWRPKSRRIIVVFTDSTYHSAGDGKMIGITHPNDMECHLVNNMDAMSVLQDYPSTSQIKKKAYEGGFRIIFAATKSVQSVYEALARTIESVSYSELKSDVVKLIVDQYTTAVNTVKLISTQNPYVDIAFDQNCNVKQMRNCESTHDKPQVDINVTLTVKSCHSKNQKIIISPSALSDKLVIDLEIDCKCDCEKKIHPPGSTSPRCNNGGVLQCGICKCHPNRYGRNCQCSGNSTITQDIMNCKQDPMDSKYCNGNGDCSCGTCICHKGENGNNGFYGDFCQYNDDFCPGSGREKCSGEDHGICRFNECHCKDGYINTVEKKDCSCAINDDQCRAPYSKEVCSGYGICECGKCICNKISPDKNDTYLGKFCDSSDEYAEKRCIELGEYAYCNYLYNQSFCDTKSSEAYDAEVILVNKTDFNAPFDSGSTPTSCKKTLDDGSFILFKYYYEPKENNKLKMRIQKEPEFPPKANIYIAAGSAIGVVLLIGLLTLIAWKIMVDLHDKREYQKFSAEATAAGYSINTNPLYQKPAHSFSNPVWNSRENL